MLLKPGLVLLKNFLTKKESDNLANIFISLKEKFKASENRERFYSRIESLPDKKLILDMSNRIVTNANKIDNSLKIIDYTHAIFLKYSKDSNLKLHRDISPNDGLEDYPIISISGGRSCLFKYIDDKELKFLELNHDDILIFGGKSRFFSHGVEKIYNNGFYNENVGDVRYSLTIRVPENKNDDEFQNYTPEQYLADLIRYRKGCKIN